MSLRSHWPRAIFSGILVQSLLIGMSVLRWRTP